MTFNQKQHYALMQQQQYTKQLQALAKLSPEEICKQVMPKSLKDQLQVSECILKRLETHEESREDIDKDHLSLFISQIDGKQNEIQQQQKVRRQISLSNSTRIQQQYEENQSLYVPTVPRKRRFYMIKGMKPLIQPDVNMNRQTRLPTPRVFGRAWRI